MPWRPTTVGENRATAKKLDTSFILAAEVLSLAMDTSYHASGEIILALDHSAWAILM
jgi:hypothetical protein